MNRAAELKIALVHDYLAQEGGAERVLHIFQELFPQAPTYTLFYDQAKMGGLYRGKDIRTSYLQKAPGIFKHYQWYLALMPSATESYDLSQYDFVLSSASAFAKGVITQQDAYHLCYCHTPTRYLWSDTHSYVKELHYPAVIKKILPPLLSRLRVWDLSAANRVDGFIANSNYIANRISKYYQRQSKVIYPPVDVEKFKVSNEVGNYYLAGGRLVAYKRFDLVVQAFNQLKMPLKIFGAGPELEHLKKIANRNIQFVGRVGDEKLVDLYSHAVAYIHPQVEDFGITAIESMASGRPVVAYKVGGAAETVIENKTGIFFDDQSWEALADTIVRFNDNSFNSADIRRHAEAFSISTFKANIKSTIEEIMNKPEHERRY
ncbi:MAG: glycosyltransferase family 4 protein [Candidatus Buchananbacteria bacterium CG10_big_fil_rev_8_21_14_0_10_42_9]|uniref:Glycosyltransferase family 4 protein n=1 Tax=Candidatus Buchananbacteria bacterium CG10_big_fil_rev_8_21_14_0_10_42_9 TaxID=1974526 RepID=A0A2H0W276_9BACT|nr:MAG: glycosyltransferase family 4 protein [Candidatus Buchananbacteria bacterium CG10_big_fil_rev_8_21_14_0_10_42_9]